MNLIIEHTPTNPISTTILIILNFLHINYDIKIVDINNMLTNIKNCTITQNFYYPLDFYRKLIINNNISDQLLHNMDSNILKWESYLHSYVLYEIYFKTALLKITNQHNNLNEMQIGIKNQANFLKQLNEVLNNKYYLIDKISICDMSLFSYLSAFDYFFQIKWYDYSNVKNYYVALKSITSFNTVLSHSFKFLKPPTHYEKLDF